jgi:hypothetical protein
VTPFARIQELLALPSQPRVKWAEYTRGSFTIRTLRGRVTRATKSTIWVEVDGSGVMQSMRLIKRVEAFDVDLLTPHELALEVWARSKPATRYLQVDTPGFAEKIYEPGARLVTYIKNVGPVDDLLPYLDQLSDEAQRMRQWVIRRPLP